jgi:hypothetical protein
MPYRLSINRTKKYIRFKLTGELTEPEIDSAIKDLQRARQKHKLNCILCDQLKLQVPPDNLVGFLTVHKLTSNPFVGLKLAIVRPDTTQERLFGIAANNRGAMVKVFGNEEEAQRWL